MQTVSIQQVLHDIEELTQFSIRFVRSTGRKRGMIKTVQRARRGGTGSFKRKSESTGARGRHKDRGTIPITDIDAQQYLSVKVSHIIGFQGKQVRH